MSSHVQQGPTSDAVGTHAAMRAIVQDSYGTSDVFHEARIPRPMIADDEVLLQVSDLVKTYKLFMQYWVM